ncbi:MAG: efflux RND transporter periplasmic adaptor subunit [Bacteroidetes bacterium]|nr:efflux RND transporter periplasmic adaptor subunit [Bacteroidota bacterium]
MNKLVSIAFIAGTIFFASCGASSSKNEDKTVAGKKAELTALKQQRDKLNNDIQKLETDISTMDSTFGVKPKLVSITNLATENFTHYIDLQGKITTKNIYYLAPRGQGGQVKAVYVKEGDHVKKGQLILKLDDAVILTNLKQLETQLDYLKDLYNRQKNLWDQKIGTEVQLITAKNNVDNMERQIESTKEQWNYSNVYSEISGVVETVNIHVGEMFTGNPQATISIVNPDELKAVVDVPENYLSSVKKGTPVLIEVPDLNKKFNSNISLVSQLINNNSRAFTAEAKLKTESDLKPNLVALIKIQDYAASNVIVIPMTSLQTDETGKYVYVVSKVDGKLVAKKRNVIVGSVYGEKIEIKQGLQTGEQLISEGFQGLYDGQAITTES